MKTYYLCFYAFMHLCASPSMHLRIHASMHLCIHALTHLCICASMRLCLSVWSGRVCSARVGWSVGRYSGRSVSLFLMIGQGPLFNFTSAARVFPRLRHRRELRANQCCISLQTVLMQGTFNHCWMGVLPFDCCTTSCTCRLW